MYKVASYRVGRVAVLALAASLGAADARAQVTFDWATVGNAGNAADPLTGYGAVSYEYRNPTLEVDFVGFRVASPASITPDAQVDISAFFDTDVFDDLTGLPSDGQLVTPDGTTLQLGPYDGLNAVSNLSADSFLFPLDSESDFLLVYTDTLFNPNITLFSDDVGINQTIQANAEPLFPGGSNDLTFVNVTKTALDFGIEFDGQFDIGIGSEGTVVAAYIAPKLPDPPPPVTAVLDIAVGRIIPGNGGFDAFQSVDGPLPETISSVTVNGAFTYELEAEMTEVGNGRLSNHIEVKSAGGFISINTDRTTTRQAKASITGDVLIRSADDPNATGTVDVQFHFFYRAQRFEELENLNPDNRAALGHTASYFGPVGASGTLSTDTGWEWVEVITPAFVRSLDSEFSFPLTFVLSNLINPENTGGTDVLLNQELDFEFTWAPQPFIVTGELGSLANGDYTIDLSDFGLTGRHFPGSQIPEPASFALLAAGAILLRRRR